jgi:hypothetical protein
MFLENAGTYVTNYMALHLGWLILTLIALTISNLLCLILRAAATHKHPTRHWSQQRNGKTGFVRSNGWEKISLVGYLGKQTVQSWSRKDPRSCLSSSAATGNRARTGAYPAVTGITLATTWHVRGLQHPPTWFYSVPTHSNCSSCHLFFLHC